MLKLDHWVSLGELSDRLDFIDKRTPWRELYTEPEKLIVISAAFDTALILDYRRVSEPPALMAIKDLDDPQTAYVYPSVQDFMRGLRQFGVPQKEEVNVIGDPRISSRSGDAQSFWRPVSDSTPIAAETLTAFNEKWGCKLYGLPQGIKALYEVQNGGAVRFRYAPPVTVHNFRWMRPDLSTKRWNNIFPDGLLPLEAWKKFENWSQDTGLAKGQSLFDFIDRISEAGKYDDDQDDDAIEANDSLNLENEDLKVRVFVIGDHTSSNPRRLTLLDLSRDFFNRNGDLMTVEYVPKTDRFEIIFGPVMVDNIYHGLFKRVHALKKELN